MLSKFFFYSLCRTVLKMLVMALQLRDIINPQVSLNRPNHRTLKMFFLIEIEGLRDYNSALHA